MENVKEKEANKTEWWQHLLMLPIYAVAFPFTIVFAGLGMIISVLFEAPYAFINKFIEPQNKKLASFATGFISIIFLIALLWSVLVSRPRCPEGTRWIPLPVADCV